MLSGRRKASGILVGLLFAVLAAAWVVGPIASAGASLQTATSTPQSDQQETREPEDMMGQDMAGMMERHMAPIPAEYSDLSNPVRADADSLARGQAIYEANCAVCHGENGWGDGPAAEALDPRPAPVAHTAQMLSDAYLFYRLSEGGNFEPFNSAMPAWKDTLSEAERWDVINYMRVLGGDAGGMMQGDGMMGMMSMWWILILLLGIGGVIVVLWFSFRNPRGRTETPLDILKRRYASGEISAEDYQRMRHELET